jgi:hypothetical protein
LAVLEELFNVGVIVSEATVTLPSVPAAETVVATVGVTLLEVPENEAVNVGCVTVAAVEV